MKLSDGSTSIEEHTYGLNDSPLVEFTDGEGNPVTKYGPTVHRDANIYFNLIPGIFDSLNGEIIQNSREIGETDHNGAKQTNNWYSGDNNIFVSNNDEIRVHIGTPVEYNETILIDRFQPNVWDVISYSRFIDITKEYEWNTGSTIWDRKLHVRNALQEVTQPVQGNASYDVFRLKRFIHDDIPLPSTNGLIYETTTATSDALASHEPPTMEDIFNDWGVFAIGYNSDTDAYYNTLSDAPDTEPYNTWTFDSSVNSAKQTSNTPYFNGFVSNQELENYTHEVTVTSDASDDDGNGVVIAHHWDSANGKNYIISAWITNNGTFPYSLFSIRYDSDDVTAWSSGVTFGTRDHDSMYSGWSGREIRVRVDRDGDVISVRASNWDDISNYNENSVIDLDLNSDSRLTKFKGKKRYGYCNQSQRDSYYQNIKLQGGADFTTILDAETNTVHKYSDGSWQETDLTIQQIYGYPREVTNPETGKVFWITETDIIIIYSEEL